MTKSQRNYFQGLCWKIKEHQEDIICRRIDISVYKEEKAHETSYSSEKPKVQENRRANSILN